MTANKPEIEERSWEQPMSCDNINWSIRSSNDSMQKLLSFVDLEAQ
jgi:hypothetical protein